jgi:hypothetical protein
MNHVLHHPVTGSLQGLPDRISPLVPPACSTDIYADLIYRGFSGIPVVLPGSRKYALKSPLLSRLKFPVNRAFFEMG